MHGVFGVDAGRVLDESRGAGNGLTLSYLKVHGLMPWRKQAVLEKPVGDRVRHARLANASRFPLAAVGGARW